jgi:amidophosphoribosyltransferase
LWDIVLGLVHKELCIGCLTGEYPVKIPGEKARFQASLDAY